MLYTTLLIASAAFSGFAAAQNGSSSDLPPTIEPCCNVPANNIPVPTKSTWCTASQNTCPEICGGQGQIANGGNTCDQDTLEYTCKCRNGTEPAMSDYVQTVPGQMCRYWYAACTNATFAADGEGNATQQFACDQAQQQQCGNLTTKDASTTSASSSGGSRPTSTGSSESSSETSSQTSSSASESTSTPGAAVRLAQEFGAPVLAGGMIALFGIAL
ncbi:hypothetical protein PMIN06_007669 [Paraphaeosphaeria minitans]|uniref:DUF7707 domain-containing protein n=1 Tax=Paraphaeosphaeria minitans TaxID=565426 RepID=A0A9P6G7K4_9PLEO|nr:hypothetical protein PMIN01_11465 [Paraphaeosphaeria minitans]